MGILSWLQRKAKPHQYDELNQASKVSMPTGIAASKMANTETARIQSSVKKLVEYGYRIDILDDSLYEEALENIVKFGEDAVPFLVEHLGESKYISLALGKIGSSSAIDALGREISSLDSRRVEAAAFGLGYSKNPKAKPYLERALGGTFERTIAEVHHAVAWAMNQLYLAQQVDTAMKIDRENIWQQIQSIPTRFENSPEGERKRVDAIALYEAIKKELPNLKVRVPGHDFTPTNAKARAWSCLASAIYYIQNPNTNAMDTPCPEAKYCYEQASKLEPNDSYWTDCVRSVS